MESEMKMFPIYAKKPVGFRSQHTILVKTFKVSTEITGWTKFHHEENDSERNRYDETLPEVICLFVVNFQ